MTSRTASPRSARRSALRPPSPRRARPRTRPSPPSPTPPSRSRRPSPPGPRTPATSPSPTRSPSPGPTSRAPERQDALDRAALVHDTADTHLPDLTDYRVAKDDVQALDALIDVFAAALGQPRHAVAERVAQTRIVETLFPEIDRLLDRHVARFDGTPFHDVYHAARRVVDR